MYDEDNHIANHFDLLKHNLPSLQFIGIEQEKKRGRHQQFTFTEKQQYLKTFKLSRCFVYYKMFESIVLLFRTYLKAFLHDFGHTPALFFFLDGHIPFCFFIFVQD